MTEVWKQITGYPDYEVSSGGAVRAKERIRNNRLGNKIVKSALILKQSPRKDAYRVVRLRNDEQGINKTHLVHRLVAESFLELPSVLDKNLVCHNDGDPSNNSVENLRWDTQSENMRDMREHGTDPRLNRKLCPRGHRLEVPNLDQTRLKKKGQRCCLSCQRAKDYMRRHPELDLLTLSNEYYRKLVSA